MTNWVNRWSPALGIVFLILVVWEALVKMQDIPSWLLPPPSAVAITIYSDYSLLARHTLVTMQEIILGFFVALAVGGFFASASVADIAKKKTLHLKRQVLLVVVRT